jgi:prepilin-type N-terminal cleavage/methylation domain-containing protein
MEEFAKNTQQGFTLIELLVTVAIIALLASIAIPHYSDLRKRAYIVETAQDLKTLELAIVAYNHNNNVYPLNVVQGITPVELVNDGTVDSNFFGNGPPVGGNYDYEGPDQWGFVALSIRGANKMTSRDWRSLDKKLDDGDTSTGKFRLNGSTHFYYIDESVNP